MTTESEKTAEANKKTKNGFHQNGFTLNQAAASDQVFMNGDCNKNQFRDQV
jgi:hypothetical protein